MAISREFYVVAFGCVLHASADSEDAYSILDRYVWPWLPRVNEAGRPADLKLRIEKSEHRVRLLVDGVMVAIADEPGGLVTSIIQAIDEAMLQKLTALRAVHAGVVRWGGRALLLPGSTHAGKSSLVVELLRRGAEYFSDEYALIDPEGRVHPYPRPLMVRNGSAEQSPMLASEYEAEVAAEPAEVGWIFSVRYGKGGCWSVAEVPQSLALFDLLRNTPHVLADTPEMVDGFQRAVEGAACYSGIRAEACDAVERIASLIGISA